MILLFLLLVIIIQQTQIKKSKLSKEKDISQLANLLGDSIVEQILRAKNHYTTQKKTSKKRISGEVVTDLSCRKQILEDKAAKVQKLVDKELKTAQIKLRKIEVVNKKELKKGSKKTK